MGVEMDEEMHEDGDPIDLASEDPEAAQSLNLNDMYIVTARGEALVLANKWSDVDRIETVTDLVAQEIYDDMMDLIALIMSGV
jgi:hypothetical protein